MKDILKCSHFVLVSCLFYFLSISVHAQNISNVEASIVDGQLQILYKVNGVKPEMRMAVRLYTSLDNFEKPVTVGVAGDIGEDVPVFANNKIIISDPIGTFGEIRDDFSFQVKSLITYNPASLISASVNEKGKQKRKKKTVLVWEGGLQNDQVSVDLYRYEQLIVQDMYIAPGNSTKSASFKFPKQKKGGGYQMKLRFSSIEEPIATNEFVVKPKKTIVGRIFRLAVFGGALYLADDQFNNGEIFAMIFGGGTEKTSPLPDAPSLNDLPN